VSTGIALDVHLRNLDLGDGRGIQVKQKCPFGNSPSILGCLLVKCEQAVAESIASCFRLPTAHRNTFARGTKRWLHAVTKSGVEVLGGVQ
jgi:hypothetical protein